MLGKLLNFGKKDNFYLELDDKEVASVVEKVEATANQVKQETEQVVAEVKQAVTESPVAQEIQSKTTEISQEVTAKVTNVTSKSKDNQKSASKKNSQPAPQVIDTSYSDEPFWVKLMYKTSEQKAAEQASEKTFATDYLISKPQPRRRPGGSLDRFKEMARQSKVKF